MISAKQRAANERNAQKSTGPKTPEGKTASSLNNLRHGLRSENILLPGEDASVRAVLTESYYHQFKPVGPVEHRHVERLIAIDWRMRRVEAMEAGALTWTGEPLVEAMVNDFRMPFSLVSRVWRYESQMDRSYQQTLRDLRAMQAQREQSQPATIADQFPAPAAPETPGQAIEPAIHRAAEAFLLPEHNPLTEDLLIGNPPDDSVVAVPKALAATVSDPPASNQLEEQAVTRIPIGPNLTLVRRVG
jgi:hypothetical protein